MTEYGQYFVGDAQRRLYRQNREAIDQELDGLHKDVDCLSRYPHVVIASARLIQDGSGVELRYVIFDGADHEWTGKMVAQKGRAHMFQKRFYFKFKIRDTIVFLYPWWWLRCNRVSVGHCNHTNVGPFTILT